MNVLTINGSYRANGFTDQLLCNLTRTLQEKGASVEQIDLRDYPIEFCLNCRECTQCLGAKPSECVQQDGMALLIEKIESADAYILASPTNFGAVTAVFKRFMERLAVYTYWPWGKLAPTFRKAKAKKRPAILVTSSAAPALFARWSYSSVRELNDTAKVIGADVRSILNTGLIATKPYPTLDNKINTRIRAAAGKLLAA
ncbi:flavodoxin family protein [Teredinibacter haidensis]|uniref:flavodoxin family protein n=1 Tax=Teredinibacter haidensis TaxID=2731755 RepID=UPI000948DF4D|nr:flavodoxin family protein [Teredinibacter haidensis]